VSKLLPTEFCALYEEGVKQVSFITREKPTTNTSDKKYIMPTKTCELHTSAPVVEPEIPLEPEVPITPETPLEPGTTPEQGGTIDGSTSGGTTSTPETPSDGSTENDTIYSRVLSELYVLS
jgi:hypothetical protein